MSLLLFKQSIGQIKCEVVGHEIVKSEEDRLFNNESDTIYTTCYRCGANVMLKKSPENKDEYYIVDISRTNTYMPI
jgi:hypothetical protein